MYYNYTYMKHSFIIIVFIFRERYEFFLSQHIRAIFSQVSHTGQGTGIRQEYNSLSTHID